MFFGGCYEETGTPYTGRQLNKLKDFLAKSGLIYDDTIEYTVNLVDDDGELLATGSLAGNVLKCIAVEESMQGEGLSASIVTALVKRAFELGRTHLFLFTKPKNLAMFSDLGFYKIIVTDDVLLMENRPGGIRSFVSELKAESAEVITAFTEKEGRAPICGAIVANCNPFTLGHRYLIETALSKCDLLHLFILSEDKSEFSAAERFSMVQEGVRDLPGVLLHKTSDYLISQATFPTYFIKDKAKAARANCELDVRIFGEYFAGPLGITKRFAGTELNDQVTAMYNETMRDILPDYGVEFVEIERKKTSETSEVISAKKVRKLIAEGNREELIKYVPETTLTAVSSHLS